MCGAAKMTMTAASAPQGMSTRVRFCRNHPFWRETSVRALSKPCGTGRRFSEELRHLNVETCVTCERFEIMPGEGALPWAYHTLSRHRHAGDPGMPDESQKRFHPAGTCKCLIFCLHPSPREAQPLPIASAFWPIALILPEKAAWTIEHIALLPAEGGRGLRPHHPGGELAIHKNDRPLGGHDRSLRSPRGGGFSKSSPDLFMNSKQR